MTQVVKTTPQASQRKRAADFTGRQSQDLAAKNAEELKKRQQELSTLNAQIIEEKKEVVDLTAPQTNPGVIEVDEVQEVEVANPTRKIVVREDLQDVTIGFGNTYNFEAGRTYIVPKHVADHLEAQGFAW